LLCLLEGMRYIETTLRNGHWEAWDYYVDDWGGRTRAETFGDAEREEPPYWKCLTCWQDFYLWPDAAAHLDDVDADDEGRYATH
jgi:hypothetical protein